jgi:hypothetical protein
MIQSFKVRDFQHPFDLHQKLGASQALLLQGDEKMMGFFDLLPSPDSDEGKARQRLTKMVLKQL